MSALEGYEVAQLGERRLMAQVAGSNPAFKPGVDKRNPDNRRGAFCWGDDAGTVVLAICAGHAVKHLPKGPCFPRLPGGALKPGPLRMAVLMQWRMNRIHCRRHEGANRKG